MSKWNNKVSVVAYVIYKLCQQAMELSLEFRWSTLPAVFRTKNSATEFLDDFF